MSDEAKIRDLESQVLVLGNMLAAVIGLIPKSSDAVGRAAVAGPQITVAGAALQSRLQRAAK